jgi:hypothetical protein
MIRTIYTYVSKDVRISGYFLEAKRGPRTNNFVKTGLRSPYFWLPTKHSLQHFALNYICAN